MPEFDLPTVGGGRFGSRDLAATGPALLIFGSSTCPVTDNAAPGLNDLHRRYGDLWNASMKCGPGPRSEWATDAWLCVCPGR